MQVFKHLYGKNSLEELMVALGIATACVLALYALRRVLAHVLTALNQRIPGDLSQILVDAVTRTSALVILAISPYAGGQTLTLPLVVDTLIRSP
jgi:hypothetical protein